jgi:hypothetical protein
MLNPLPVRSGRGAKNQGPRQSNCASPGDGLLCVGDNRNRYNGKDILLCKEMAPASTGIHPNLIIWRSEILIFRHYPGLASTTTVAAMSAATRWP